MRRFVPPDHRFLPNSDVRTEQESEMLGYLRIAPGPQKMEYFEVPFDNNKNYVERPSITDQLERLFGYTEATAVSRARRVVLYGLGGAGKTEIAVRFAERHRQHYSAVFWVHGMDEARLKDGFERIGKVINEGNNGAYNDHVINAQRRFVKNSDWLLIIDNVDDDAALDALRGRYLKVGMDGHVVVTSRNPTTSAQWDGVEVADMNETEAAALISNITGHRSRREDPSLSKLLKDLGLLPLAIDQASSYIAATGISLQEYHRWFQIEKARLLQHFPSTQYNHDSRETVMTTWEMSFKRVEQSHAPASRLLLLMSLFSHDDIPIDMLQLDNNSLRQWASSGEFEAIPEAQEWVPLELKSTLQDRPRLREAILALRKFSFVRFKPGGESFYLHPLVHYWASHRLDSRPDRQTLTMCSIGLVTSRFEKEDRLPPIATPYGRRDVASVAEEKSLRLWPWRQSLRLAPHAHRCMWHITTLTSMSEAMAHLCLSLLQVLEYSSTKDEPVVTYRLTTHRAHDIMDHVVKFGEAPDNFLKLSVTLWRLTRAAVCNCQKLVQKRTKLCRRCQEAFEEAMQSIKTLIDRPRGFLPTARIKAASLGLLFVIFLNGGQLQKAFVMDIGKGWNHPFPYHYEGGEGRGRLILDGAPFKEWYDDPTGLSSQMEKYVYNMGCYLTVRFSSEFARSSIDYRLADQVSKAFKTLCGQRSEEYRRSVWYLTTALQDRQEWAQIHDYLEPLVAESMHNPTLSWSHERCIIRLVLALVRMGKQDEAQRLSEQVRKTYGGAGKVLRSMQGNPLLTRDKESKVFKGSPVRFQSRYQLFSN